MKDAGVLFTAPNVRLIREHLKTQTRRALYVRSKNLKTACEHNEYRPDYGNGEWPNVAVGEAWTLAAAYRWEVGQRLYVREAHVYPAPWDKFSPAEISLMIPVHFLADGTPPTGWGRYRHARFMPRARARIHLEITEKRIERLGRISFEDACAEGCAIPSLEVPSFETMAVPSVSVESWDQTSRRLRWPQRFYKQIWESINGVGSWEDNPWVLAFTFKVVG